MRGFMYEYGTKPTNTTIYIYVAICSCDIASLHNMKCNNIFFASSTGSFSLSELGQCVEVRFCMLAKLTTIIHCLKYSVLVLVLV